MKLVKDHVLEDSSLSLQIKEGQVTDWHEARRFVWEVCNQGAGEFHGVIRLEEPFPSGFHLPWLLIPGFFYGENRRFGPGIREDSYPRFDPSADKPARMTSNHWDFAADRTSYPLVYLFENGSCFAFAPRPHVICSDGCVSEDLEPQVGIGFACDGRGGYVRLGFPACEEPFTYADSTQSAPTIRRIRIPVGGTVKGELFMISFAGVRHDYQKVLEFYYGEIGRDYNCAEAGDLGGIMQDGIHGIVDWHYHDKKNYFVYSRCYDRVAEQIANHRGTTLEWHQMNTGFVSGIPTCWALNVAAGRLGDARAREVSRNVADRICREGISPSGLFWADFKPGVIEERNGSFKNPLSPDGKDSWGSGWWKEADCVHTRTIADANYALANLILSEAAQDSGSTSLPVWREALRKNLEAILELQLPNGSYGAVYNAVTREVRREAGCGGLLWIPAIIRSCEIFAADQSLVKRLENSAQLAAEAYSKSVEDEYIWGAPEDNDSPTSEDGLNAVLTYAALYRRFRKPRYLELLCLAADWMLTFRKSYNIRFHPLTLAGAYALRSKGGDYASSSNNHLHIFELMVTTELFELSRWVGNPYYRKRALDHWAFAQQLLCRVDGQFNGFRGGCAEQFYWCNWSSFGQDTRALEKNGFKGNWDPGPQHRQKGNMAGFSALWCIHVVILAADMLLREDEEHGAGTCH